MRDKPIPFELMGEWLKYAPMLTCNIVIEEDGYVLLVKRKNDPEKDKWFTPGGILVKSEWGVDKQARMIAEDEVGITLEIESSPSVVYDEHHPKGYNAYDVHLVTLVFYANPNPPRQIPKTNEDHDEVQWFKLSKNAPWWIGGGCELGKGVQDFVTEALRER